MDPKGLDSEIIQDADSKYGHQVLHIFDPKMPGNSVYVDLMPVRDVTLTDVILNRSMGADVGIGGARPEGEALHGSFRELSTQATSDLLQRAYNAESAAREGALQYAPRSFQMQNNGGRTISNCQGFASGL
jgi:hypothetical protein